MKITKLVILFNKDKILLGLGLAITCIVFSFFVSKLNLLFLILAFLIILNILLALLASYLLYDHSKLYKPKELFKSLTFKKEDQAIFLHASFDPVSRVLEALIAPASLRVYNIYGNRHEDEKAIAISNATFPPHPKQIILNPTQIPEKEDSLDYIFSITSLHEILTQEKRIAFFKEANRILKPGGTLIICEQLKGWINFLFFNIGVFHFVSLKDWK